VTLRFLLDTNAISEPLRPSPDPGVLRRLREHRSEIGIAAPVWHELLFGYRRLPASRKRDAIEGYLLRSVEASFPILAYDDRAASWHATERARLSARGETPPYIDGQIAAIAKVADLVLVTANISDFGRFEGLRTENWQT
jgi:tRNA(fMet)-specific endonuclease VapC